MARKAVVDAVNSRLAANWSATPVFGLGVEGDPPTDGSAFVMVQYPVAGERQMSMGAPGANVWREEGAFRLVLNEPRGQGIDTLLTRADALAAIFRGQLFAGVQCFEASGPTVDDRNESGNYIQASVAVAYQHDLIG